MATGSRKTGLRDEAAVIKRPETVLFRAAAVWTVIGLVGGLAYREVTRAAEFTGFTQLALVHTHALALGTTVLLVVLVLERLYALHTDRWLRWFVWLWNLGLGITVAGLAVKGTLQVHASTAADSAALAGFSGTGHILLTAGFVVLLLVLGRRVREREPHDVVSAPVS